MNEFEWWVFVLAIIASSIGFGFCIGYVRGRGSMLQEIYGRRLKSYRQGVVRRAWKRLENSVAERGNVLNAEVIE